MDIALSMDEVAEKLRTIPKLVSVQAHAASSITVPGAVLGYPSMQYHVTYARGATRMTLPIWVVIAKASDEAARDKLSAFASDSGPSSVIAVLEAGSYTQFDELTVTSMEPDSITVGTSDYLAAMFSLDLIGRGAD